METFEIVSAFLYDALSSIEERRLGFSRWLIESESTVPMSMQETWLSVFSGGICVSNSG